jgi:hypothetical protein
VKVESIFLEVEENPNCGYMPLQVYEAHREPVPIRKLILAEPDRPHGVYWVTGWSSEGGGTPCPAMYTPVSDSGQGVAHLVYGGDWGIRLKPEASDEDWDIASPNQHGEPYLALIDEADIILNN